ncbi:MAG TPA: hypothetical protein VK042_00580 [Atopostipes sp.]|nr:hypothetical protein [Atopostipes sp.]
MKRENSKFFLKKQELIVDATRLYFITEENPENPVNVDTLLKEGYLEERANDPVQKGTVTREEKKDGDAVIYSYEFEPNGN